MPFANFINAYDIHNEAVISIREALRHLPRRPTGKRVHISAVYRWVSRGVRGIILESIRIGGTTYTSIEALQRFADRLSERDSTLPPSAHSTTRSRQKQIDAAEQRLREVLGGGADPCP